MSSDRRRAAAIFDLDGLIVDTERTELESVARVFAAHRATFPTDRWLETIGSAGDPRWVAWLEEQCGKKFDAEALHAARRRHRDELFETMELLPGVVDLLEQGRRLGIAMAVASSSDSRWVERHLGRYNLRAYFQHVFCRDHVARAKPWPDLYLAALDALDADASRSVAFEDSHHGSMAAKRAGLHCVVCPNPITAGQDFSHADAVVATLDGLSLESVLAAAHAKATNGRQGTPPGTSGAPGNLQIS